MSQFNLEGYDKKLELYYFRVTDLWRKLCEEHNLLLDQTCDEYALLLANKLEELEQKIESKQETVTRITNIEKLRAEVIEELNTFLKENNIGSVESVKELIELMSQFEKVNNQKHLFRFNALLIDIISKIQAQNKNNQLFINKALLNLRSIREEALGMKSYSTYTSTGGTKSKALDAR